MSYEEQRVIILGPYRVAFDDALTDGVIIVGEDLPNPSVIVAAWAALVTSWDGTPTDPSLRIDLWQELAFGGPGSGPLDEILYAMDPTGGAYGDDPVSAPVIPAAGPQAVPSFARWQRGPVPTIVRDVVKLAVKVTGLVDTTQGEADIYAVIATPG